MSSGERKRHLRPDGKWIILFLGSKCNPTLLLSSRGPPCSAAACGGHSSSRKSRPWSGWDLSPKPLCPCKSYFLYQHFFKYSISLQKFPGGSPKHFSHTKRNNSKTKDAQVLRKTDEGTKRENCTKRKLEWGKPCYLLSISLHIRKLEEKYSEASLISVCWFCNFKWNTVRLHLTVSVDSATLSEMMYNEINFIIS